MTMGSSWQLAVLAVFVAFGLAMGKMLRRCRNLDRLFAFVTLLTVSFVVLSASATMVRYRPFSRFKL